MTFRILAAGLILMTALAAAAQAPVGLSAQYDPDADVLLEGKVTSVDWGPEHVVVHMDVTNASGVSTKSAGSTSRPTGRWTVEGGPPNSMLHAGITQDSLQVGADLVVRGYWAKDKRCAPACKARGRDVTFADGRRLFMGSSG